MPANHGRHGDANAPKDRLDHKGVSRWLEKNPTALVPLLEISEFAYNAKLTECNVYNLVVDSYVNNLPDEAIAEKVGLTPNRVRILRKLGLGLIGVNVYSEFSGRLRGDSLASAVKGIRYAWDRKQKATNNGKKKREPHYQTVALPEFYIDMWISLFEMANTRGTNGHPIASRELARPYRPYLVDFKGKLVKEYPESAINLDFLVRSFKALILWGYVIPRPSHRQPRTYTVLDPGLFLLVELENHPRIQQRLGESKNDR